jgi:hypothetical protein
MTGFYENKGKVRYTLILDKEAKDKLTKLAKAYKITQGEVAEVLIDKFDLNVFDAHFTAKRANKETTRTDLVKKMINLTPEQIAAIDAILSRPQA